VSATGELAALAAEFPGWHIWRGRSASGRETDWNATSSLRRNGKRRRLSAPDAAALRALLAQDEALRAGAAA
jgi:hypothetical protein